MSLREDILENFFVPFDGQFTRGQAANNKLPLDSKALSRHPAIKQAVVSGLADLAEPYKPDFISGVPTGATDIAAWVAYELSVRRDKDIYVVALDKAEDKMQVANEIEQDTLDHVGSGVAVDDVFNRFTNIRLALGIPILGPKIKAAFAIWDRGLLHPRGTLNVPHQALIEEHIAETLPESSPLQQYLQGK